MKTKLTVLKCGIVIKDSRSLSCGISIENQNTKYITLAYSKDIGFYLNTKGVWLKAKDVEEYQKELELMKEALIEANKLI